MDTNINDSPIGNAEHPLESPLLAEKRGNWVKVLLAIGVVVIFSVIGFYLGKANQGETTSSDQTTVTPSIIPSSFPQQALQPGWTRYIHPIYKYRVDLPPGWTAYTKVFEPTKGIEFRSSDYTELQSESGWPASYQQTGQRIFFAYQNEGVNLNGYKDALDSTTFDWLNTKAEYKRMVPMSDTDAIPVIFLSTKINNQTYQIYAHDPALKDLLLKVASSMQLGQSDWKTHKTSFMSFSYPPDQALEERQKGFFVILQDHDYPMNSTVSIDTRSNEHKTTFNDYVAYIKSTLQNPTEEQIKNGVIITGKVGPGFLEGSTLRSAIFGRVDNRIFTVDAPPNANQQQIELFEQIVSTISY